MIPEQARQIVEKHRDAVSFVKSSHLEELSPLVEVVIEVVQVLKKDFHCLPGNVYYPRKETTDRFGSAAGISFASVEIGTRREDGAIVGRAIPQEVGPDGKIVQWAPAEYEFDPELRAEEDIIRDEEKPRDKQRYGSESRKRMLVLQYKKVARRRADTGARAAAIISAIGMPTGFKDLFRNGDPDTATRTFLFSRIVANAKNERVLNRALDNMFGQAQQLYGGHTAQAAIEAPSERLAAAVPVEPEDDPGFGDNVESDRLSHEDQARNDAVEMLCQLRDENDWSLHPTKLQTIQDTIDNAEDIPVDKLLEFHTRVKGFVDSGAIAQPPQGAAS